MKQFRKIKNYGILGIIPFFVVAEEPESEGETFPSRDLIELYRAADYFILPSYIETYASVALGAMASGIPVIVTNTPGCRDSVVNYQDGIIVHTHSPDAIAHAVQEIDSSSKLRQELVSAGQLKAQSQNWDNIAQRHLAAYESLVSPERNKKNGEIATLVED